MDKAAVQHGNNMATDFYSFCVLAFEVLSGELIPVIPHLDALLKRQNPTIPEKVPNELRECLMSGFDEELLGQKLSLLCVNTCYTHT